MPKQELVRHVLSPQGGEFLVDESQTQPGRGWYVCSETACREKTGADLKLVLENIRKLTDAGKTVELRIPVIPGYSDTAEYMERAAALTAALRAESVMLLPFHRLGAPKYRALGLEYEYQTVPGVERSLLERLSRAFRWQTVKF